MGAIFPTIASPLQVIEGVSLSGETNVSDETYLAHITASIRRGHPQIRQQAITYDRVCLVGGGPSLDDTLPHLLALVRDGAKLVTVNGAYQWCLDHHLTPVTQIIVDARASNARFVQPAIPRCNYLLASTCHADVWEAVEGRERVWIWHPVTRSEETDATRLLDDYYLAQWTPVGGGTTVVTRAIYALRLLGYLRFDLFGVDCCWRGDQHHAYPQPENAHDLAYAVTAHPSGHAGLSRTFVCSGWHVKQLEDFLQIIRVNGDHVLLNVHGDGLLSHVMQSCATADDLVITPLTTVPTEV